MIILKTKRPVSLAFETGLFNFKSRGVLLSHTVAHVVPSALEGLTSVFGMGTGVTPPVWPREDYKTVFRVRYP